MSGSDSEFVFQPDPGNARRITVPAPAEGVRVGSIAAIARWSGRNVRRITDWRLRGLGLKRQLGVGGDIADIAIVADETNLAVAPLEPHNVARRRIGAVFEDRDHLTTLEPMSSPSMADPMRGAPTSLMAPPDADPRHHTRVCLRRGAWSASGPRGGGPGARDPNCSVVHSAHAAAWHGRSLLLLRRLSDHGFGGYHETCD
jgi:hypothetical protein